MGKVTNPFAPVKKAGGEVSSEVEDFERPEYVEPEAAEEIETEEQVPDGTAKEVLQWVGDNENRARKALDVEEAKGDDGRKGLKRELTAKLEN